MSNAGRQFVAFTGAGYKLGPDGEQTLPVRGCDEEVVMEERAEQGDQTLVALEAPRGGDTGGAMVLAASKDAFEKWLMLATAWQQASTVEAPLQQRIEDFIMDGTKLMSAFDELVDCQLLDAWFSEARALQGVMRRVYQFAYKATDDNEPAAPKPTPEPTPEKDDDEPPATQPRVDQYHHEDVPVTQASGEDHDGTGNDDDSLDEDMLFSPAKRARRLRGKSNFRNKR